MRVRVARVARASGVRCARTLGVRDAGALEGLRVGTRWLRPRVAVNRGFGVGAGMSGGWW